MVVGWSVVFIVLGWIRQDRFATFSFDLGIYDQAVWLLSRFHDPFVTVRGLEFFGHHVNPILLLFVPFYWLGAGPLFLLVGAGGGAGVGRDRDLPAGARPDPRPLARGGAGRGPAAQPHLPVAHVGVLPSRRARDRAAAVRVLGGADRAVEWFVLFAVLAAACKEDVALAVAVMGVLIAVRGHRKIGCSSSLGASIAWYTIATRVIIPWQNGIGPFYDSFFGDLGKNPIEVGTHLATHPRAGRRARHRARPASATTR